MMIVVVVAVVVAMMKMRMEEGAGLGKDRCVGLYKDATLGPRILTVTLSL